LKALQTRSAGLRPGSESADCDKMEDFQPVLTLQFPPKEKVAKIVPYGSLGADFYL
jgi:hypothetical protein